MLRENPFAVWYKTLTFHINKPFLCVLHQLDGLLLSRYSGYFRNISEISMYCYL